MITIIDYDAGNLQSIVNMLKKIGVESTVAANATEIESAAKLILPGVGRFDSGMSKLHEKKLTDAINKRVLHDKIPILGICLGMQLMTKCSEEGQMSGFGWINAETVKFKFSDSSIKIPNMGWLDVKSTKSNSLMKNIPDEPRFYFVHSYYVNCNNPEDVILTANYGCEFHCGFQKENIFGVQFHPEKSHKYGMTLLKNFAEV